MTFLENVLTDAIPMSVCEYEDTSSRLALLCTKDLKRFENCANSSGWVVTGISPETWERETRWGRMKFDPGSLAASCDYDGKTAYIVCDHHLVVIA